MHNLPCERNIDPENHLHDNPSRYTLLKLNALVLCNFIKNQALRLQEKMAINTTPIVKFLLQIALHPNCVRLEILFTLKVLEHYASTLELFEKTPPAQPTGILIGSYRSTLGDRYSDNKITPTQPCNLLAKNITILELEQSFPAQQNNIPDNALMLLKFACGLLNQTTVAIRKNSWSSSLCNDVSGSPTNYDGIRNEGLTKIFFDDFQDYFKAKNRFWLDCQTEPMSWHSFMLTCVEYSTATASFLLNIFAFYCALKLTYDAIILSSQLLSTVGNKLSEYRKKNDIADEAIIPSITFGK